MTVDELADSVENIADFVVENQAKFENIFDIGTEDEEENDMAEGAQSFQD